MVFNVVTTGLSSLGSRDKAMVEKSLPCRLARSFDRCFNGDSPQVMPKKRMSARIGTLIIKGVMAATVSESVKVKRLLTG